MAELPPSGPGFGLDTMDPMDPTDPQFQQLEQSEALAPPVSGSHLEPITPNGVPASELQRMYDRPAALTAAGETPEPPTDWSDEAIRNRLKLQVVDVTSGVEANARDYARQQVNEKIEGREGDRAGFFKRAVRRAWYGNIARDAYQISETKKAREAILESGDLYANTSDTTLEHDTVTGAVVDRFVASSVNAEYSSIFRHDGETQQDAADVEGGTELQNQLRQLITDKLVELQASGGRDLTEADEQEVNDAARALLGARGGLHGHNVGAVLKSAHELVGQISAAEGWQAGIDRVSGAMDLSIGEARMGARTEVRLSGAEKALDWMAKKPGLCVVNETTVGAAAAAGVYVAAMAGKAVARKGLEAVPFAGAVVAGLWAGTRAKRQTKLDIETFAHKYEQGEVGLDAAGKQNGKMAEVQGRLEAKGIGELSNAIEAGIGGLGNDRESLQALISAISEAKILRSMSDYQGRNADNVGMIHAGDLSEVEALARFADFSGNAKLNLGRAYLNTMIADGNVQLRERATTLGISAEDLEGMLLTSERTVSDRAEEQIDSRSRLAAKLEWSEAAKTAAIAAASSLLVGTSIHEVVGLVSPNVQSVFESRSSGDHAQTQLASWFRDGGSGGSGGGTGGAETSLMAAQEVGRHTVDFSDNVHFDVSDNLNLQHNPDGTLAFVNSDGHQVGEAFNPNASAADIQQQLAGSGAQVDVSQHVESTIAGTSPNDAPIPTGNFIDQHPDQFTQIHRDMWYDNNTSGKFDKNELGLHYGADGTGVDANGNYVVDVSTMTDSGAYHGDSAAHVQQLAREGKLKMSVTFDRDHQSQAVLLDGKVVPNGSGGEKVVFTIDKNSLAGQAFQNNGGHAEFNGAFAEIVEARESNQDGSQVVRPIATITGNNSVTELKPPTTDVTDIRVSAPAAESPIPFAYTGEPVDIPTVPLVPTPLYGRRGLEPNQAPEDEATRLELPPTQPRPPIAQRPPQLDLPPIPRQRPPERLAITPSPATEQGRPELTRNPDDEVLEGELEGEGTPRPGRSDDDIIDAEIVPEPAESGTAALPSSPQPVSQPSNALPPAGGEGPSDPRLNQTPQAVPAPAAGRAGRSPFDAIGILGGDRASTPEDVARFNAQMGSIFGPVLGAAGEAMGRYFADNPDRANGPALRVELLRWLGADYRINLNGDVQVTDWRSVDMSRMDKLRQSVTGNTSSGTSAAESTDVNPELASLLDELVQRLIDEQETAAAAA